MSTLQHRSFLSDCWSLHLKGWTRSICAVKMSVPSFCRVQHSVYLSLPGPLGCTHRHTCLTPLLLPVVHVLQEQQYAQWMAGCRLASKGKSLADSSFQSEIQSIRSFLAMQKTNSGSSNNSVASDESINTHSLVSPRYHKKYKPKQVKEGRVFALLHSQNTQQYLLIWF